MKFSEFLEFEPRKPSHVYTFLCEDELLVEEARAVWRRIFAAGSGGDWEFERMAVKEFEAMEPAALIEAALSPPLFGPSRVLMVFDAARLTKKRLEAVGEVAALAASSIRIILVIRSGKKPARGGAFPTVAIDAVGPGDAARWLRKKYGVDAEVARYLVENLGCELRPLASEMEKLTAYAGGDRPVGVDDVDLLTLRVDQSSPFEFDDAVLAGDAVRAVALAEAMLSGGAEPLVVLARIARIWRQLTVGQGLLGRVGPREMAAAASVPHWKAGAFRSACERVSGQRLKAGFPELVRADRRFKSSATDPRLVLDLLLWRLLGAADPPGVRPRSD
jgi:DNA polymerase-3 subunit delta